VPVVTASGGLAERHGRSNAASGEQPGQVSGSTAARGRGCRAGAGPRGLPADRTDEVARRLRPRSVTPPGGT